jgi:DNA-binding response OmpR family regulator
LLHAHADRLQAPGIRVLPKPFSLDELMAQVRELIGLPAPVPPKPTAKKPRRPTGRARRG